jgi:hypothetical protein
MKDERAVAISGFSFRPSDLSGDSDWVRRTPPVGYSHS